MNKANLTYGLEETFPTLLDNTQISNFRACEEKAHLYSSLKRVPVGKNPHLNAGGAFAHGMDTFRKEYYGNHKTREDALADAILAAIKFYGNYEPIGADSARSKTWDRVCAAMISYTEVYDPESDHLRPAIFEGNPSSEFSFAVPLPINHPVTDEPILYGGVFDAMMRFGTGGYKHGGDYSHLPLYGYDDKTTYAMGASWSSEWDMRGQFLGYYWAAQQMGFPLEGFIIRGTAIQKTQIKHQEAILYFPSWKVEQWYDNLLTTIYRMIDRYLTGDWGKNWGDSCTAYGGCPYKILCDSPTPEKWVSTHFETRTWSPVDLEKF